MEAAPGNLGTIVMAIIATVGALGGYFTLRAKAGETATRVSTLERDVDAVGKDLNELRLQVARDAKDYVNRTDLRDGLKEVEGRLGKRLDDVEHTVRNSITRMTGEIREMIRDVLPKGRPS